MSGKLALPHVSPSSIYKKRLQRNILQNQLYTEENLGENFDESPWLPPSLDKAMQHKQETVFRGGAADLRCTVVVDSPDLGVGVSMYFQFVKSLAVCMFVMSLLSIPCLLFSYNGKKIPQAGKLMHVLYLL